MPAWVAILIGAFLLIMVFIDRGNIRQAWRSPARWWNQREYLDSRAPSQPLNLVLGLLLGSACLIYGIVTLASN